MLPQPVHKELTDEDKKLWAKMSPEGRNRKGIVKWGSSGGNGFSSGNESVQGSRPNYPSTPSPSRPPQRRAYVTDQQPTVLNEPEPVNTTPPPDTPVRSMNALSIMNTVRSPISREELSANGREDLRWRIHFQQVIQVVSYLTALIFLVEMHSHQKMGRRL